MSMLRIRIRHLQLVMEVMTLLVSRSFVVAVILAVVMAVVSAVAVAAAAAAVVVGNSSSTY